MQIISRDMDMSYSGGRTKKVSNLGKLNARTGIDLINSSNAYYTNLPNAGTNETWYGIKFGSSSSYSKTGYAPFGVQNLQLSVKQTGLKFVIDLVHTETNSEGKTYETEPIVSTSAGYGKFISSPFNTVINDWVSVDENNVLKVYVSSVNDTYFDQLDSAFRTQLCMEVIGHWETATSTYNITDISTNCTGNNTQTTIEKGENYTNTFTPNEGFAFNENNKPYAVCAGVTYQSTLNQDGTATITINNVSGNIEINGNPLAKYSLNLELYNCVLYDGENPYELDYVLEGETYHFILHSVEGFLFKTFPTWTMGEETGQFALNSSDKTIASIIWNLHPYIFSP